VRGCSRTQLLQFTANLQADLIGMEACAGAHFLGRTLREQGHEVRIIPAQYVEPYVKTNKSDYIDAEAIAEAVGRPTMRFVAIKTDDQLDMQSLHPVRERWVIRRTAVVNQIRGLLLERGIILRQGRGIWKQLCRASSKMRIPDCLALFVCSSRSLSRICWRERSGLFSSAVGQMGAWRSARIWIFRCCLASMRTRALG
jgi:hypothetical protein